jgi:linoleoyl-CoA desaturase
VVGAEHVGELCPLTTFSSFPAIVRRMPAPTSGAGSRRVRDRLGLSSDRVEPWRDWAVLGLFNNGLLAAVAVVRPSLPWLMLTALPLGLGLATATLTVLHDAGHRRLSSHLWLNVLAVQTAAPVGLWVAHWTLKHRVHHRVTQIYPLDENTRSSGLVRLHPSAPRLRVHRGQHFYAWLLYGLAWVGELRSQLGYVRSGMPGGAPGRAARARSFGAEKALCALVLVPYVWFIGPGRLAMLLVVAMTLGSAVAAVILVVGHINTGLSPTSDAPEGREAWATHLLQTSASFSTQSWVTRWLTGGMTHHLAHHLRATAPRGELPILHTTTVAELSAATGSPIVEYPTLASAVAGHWRALRDLGRPEAVRHSELDPGAPSVSAPT